MTFYVPYFRWYMAENPRLQIFFRFCTFFFLLCKRWGGFFLQLDVFISTVWTDNFLTYQHEFLSQQCHILLANPLSIRGWAISEPLSYANAIFSKPLLPGFQSFIIVTIHIRIYIYAYCCLSLGHVRYEEILSSSIDLETQCYNLSTSRWLFIMPEW